MGLILFLIATTATIFFSVLWIPFSIIYHIVTFKFVTGIKRIDKYFYQMALSTDQFANVSLQTLFNKIMITGQRKHRFGDEDDTLSYIFAKNKIRNTLTKFGNFWACFLNKVDKGHLDNAIENKIVRDHEAYVRYSNGKYYK